MRVRERDAATLMELLWGTARSAPRRGPRPGLTVERVVRTAIEIADRDGLADVTMRRLAESLGVGPMAIYTYVPGKAELIELMLDALYGAMPRSPWAGGDWRERLAQVARDNRALYHAHPWAARVSTSRPPLGPGLMAKYEHELGALAESGLDDVDTDAALTFVLDFVRSWARAAHDARAATRESGLTDAEWWATNAPLLERVTDEQAFPTATRVGTAAGAAQGGAYSPDRAWEFGLERVLDGLQVLVDRGSGDRR